MDNAKKWYLSKTIWGGLSMAVGVALRYAGYEISNEDLNSAVDGILAALSGVLEVVGLIMTIYGRVKATTKIK